MVYVKQIWADEDPDRPVSAARMLYIENGLEAVSASVDLVAEPRDINVRTLGVIPANTPSVNTALIQQIITDAPNGSRLLFPYDPSPIQINSGLTVPPGKTIRFEGLGGQAKITQTVWAKPVFDLLNADGSSVENFDLVMTGTKAMTGGSFRDGTLRHYACAVWACGSRLTVRNIRTTGFTSGVRLTNWVNSLGARSGFASDCLFEGIVSDGCDWGIVGTGWKRVTCRDVSGNYTLTPTSGDPSHLIYVSDGQPNVDVTIENVNAYDGTGGCAYSFKDIDGLTVTNLVSRNCEASLNLADVVGGRLSSLYITEDAPVSDDGSIYTFGANQDIVLRDLVMTLRVSARAIRWTGTDMTLKDARITVPHTTNKSNGDVYVVTTRGLLENVRIVNTGTGTNVGIFILGTCVDTTIRGGGGTNTYRYVLNNPGATGTTVEYDPAATTPNPLSGYRVVYTTGNLTTTRIRPARTVVPFSTTGGTVQVRADQVTHASITATGSGAITVSLVEPFIGATITYVVTNSTAGAMGTVTWTGHTLATAYTSPAAGLSNTITFLYDGTGWREISRGS